VARHLPSIAVCGRQRRAPLVAALWLAAGLGGTMGLSCAAAPRSQDEGVQLAQHVTTRRAPRDPAFDDFEAGWRRFVSPAAELAEPVGNGPQDSIPWTPAIAAECVHSAAAGGEVPMVTLSWREPRSKSEEVAVVARLDLTVHHRGFERAYFTSVRLGSDQSRLLLPASSALVADLDALLLTGPVIYPAVTSFRREPAEDGDRVVAALRDLGEGLTYTVRLSLRQDGAWLQSGQAMVLAPVCAGVT
jgi:hypothetical protein